MEKRKRRRRRKGGLEFNLTRRARFLSLPLSADASSVLVRQAHTEREGERES
jgi:hypothetical protein